MFHYLCPISGVLYTGAVDLGSGGFPRMISAAFSAIIIVGPLRFPLTMLGIIDASTILRFSTPNTSVLLLTTAIGSSSAPILHVHAGWWTVSTVCRTQASICWSVWTWSPQKTECIKWGKKNKRALNWSSTTIKNKQRLKTGKRFLKKKNTIHTLHSSEHCYILLWLTRNTYKTPFHFYRAIEVWLAWKWRHRGITHFLYEWFRTRSCFDRKQRQKDMEMFYCKMKRL